MARSRQRDNRAFSRTAFLVEALVLLVVVAGVLAILMTLFAQAYNAGKESREDAQAILLVSNAAESFSADPQEGVVVSQGESLVACCVVEAQEQVGGVLYLAHIAVYKDTRAGELPQGGESAADYVSRLEQFEAVYQLDTARYVSEVAA